MPRWEPSLWSDLHGCTVSVNIIVGWGMIVSFADAATAELYDGLFGKPRYPIAIIRLGRRRLSQLHAASTLAELGRIPGNRLEKLHGDLAGHHSIRVNDQWRIVFRWTGEGAEAVRLTDYHA